VLDGHYPTWLNHGVHTMPLLLGLLELRHERHNYTSNTRSVVLLCTFLLSYLIWTFYLALVADLWVYGVLRVMGWPGRIAFMAGNLGVAVVMFFLGKQLDTHTWSSERALAAEKISGKKSR